jgi:hypothetical protein
VTPTTPLVHKLRELDKRVIGIGVQSSTSALLPPACDEFLFYDRLPGVEPSQESRRRRGRGRQSSVAPPSVSMPSGSITIPTPSGATANADGTDPVVDVPVEEAVEAGEERDMSLLVARTLAGLQRHSDGPVLASMLKRAILRKDPTFDEADQGFRGFGELLRHLESQRVVELRQGSAQGDPEVAFPDDDSANHDAFRLLVDVVRELQTSGAAPQLSGLKNQLRKRRSDFSEKRYGFNSFLSFAKAARARDLIAMDWDDDSGDYLLRVPG